MAVVQMKKIAVIAHRSKEEALLELLQKEGVLEISNIPESVDIDHTEVNFRYAELDFAIQTLMPFADKKTQAALRRKATEEQIVHAALHVDIAQTIADVHGLEAEAKNMQTRLALLEGGRGGVGGDDVQPAYFTSSSIKDETDRIGSGVRAPSPDQEQAIMLEQATVKKSLYDIEEKRKSLATELPSLVLARQYLRWLHDKQAVREAMQRTRSTVIVMGWLPKNRLQVLESKLERTLPQSALLKIKPDEDEESPILLNNPVFLKPFESVTTLYGLPQSSEMDPTPMLSLFFILFFGLCLTDAGYGLVLAIVMGLFIWKKKLSIEEGRLWWLLLIGGIVTFFVSIPFGGWFGLTPDKVPAIFTVDTNGDGIADLFKGQIWNLGETKGITFLQNLSIALGLIHLSVGIFLAGISKWISGQKAAAFWVDWTTLILFVTIGAYFFVPLEMQPFALYGIYAALALVIWGKGYGSSFFMRPIFGLLGILNLAMGMLSNTLSYLRLLALGLVTGALALAVNLVGEQIGGLLPIYLAIPVMVIIYFLGHLVNIALNTLGAFIHSGRLQFVEFFSQFFEGGGRPFQPFKRSLPSAS